LNEKKIVAFRQKPQEKIAFKPLKKKPKDFFFSLLIGVSVLAVFYFATPISRLQVIYFEGGGLLTRSEVVALSGLRENAFIPSLRYRAVEADLSKHPLVESAQVSLRGINRLSIAIKEKDVIACARIGEALHYVLETGATLPNQGGTLPICRGVVIYGLTEEALSENVLALFTAAMAELDPLFVSLINHVDYAPKWGNPHRFTLSMRDGFTVNVTSHTMLENLSRYQTWVNSLESGVRGTFNFDVGRFFQPFDDASEELQPETTLDAVGETTNFPVGAMGQEDGYYVEISGQDLE